MPQVDDAPIQFKAPPKEPKDPVQEITPELRLFVKTWRNPKCQKCPLFQYQPGKACFPGFGPVKRGTPMIIAERPSYWDFERRRPLLQQPGAYFDRVLEAAGIERSDFYITHAVKCKGSQDGITPKVLAVAQQECASYLDAEIAAIEPPVILAMGASAFYYFTHKPGGVFKARGDAIVWEKANHPTVIFTISPAAVLRSPAYHAPFVTDVRKFARYLAGEVSEPAVEVVEVHTPAEFNAAVAELWAQPEKVLTFDLETRGFVAHQPDYSKVWLGAFTRGQASPGAPIRSFMLPLEHLDSPFLQADGRCHPAVVREVLKLIFGNRVSGHNILFDVLHSHYLAERYDLDMREPFKGPEAIPEDADAWTIEHPRPEPEPKPKRARKSAGVDGAKPKRAAKGAGGGRGAAESGSGQLALPIPADGEPAADGSEADGRGAGEARPTDRGVHQADGVHADTAATPGPTAADGELDGAARGAGGPGEPAPEPEGSGDAGGHGERVGQLDPEPGRGAGEAAAC